RLAMMRSRGQERKKSKFGTSIEGEEIRTREAYSRCIDFFGSRSAENPVKQKMHFSLINRTFSHFRHRRIIIFAGAAAPLYLQRDYPLLHTGVATVANASSR